MNDLFDFASKLGGAPLATVLIFVFAAIGLSSMRGDWCWRRELQDEKERHAETKKDRDEWKELALARRENVENAVVDIAKRRRP